MGVLQYKEVPLNGKWRKGIDPLLADEADFTDIQNLRPYERGYRAVNGMTKINTTAVDATYLKARAGFHFSKESPASESHILVQAWNAGETASTVWQNTTAIGSNGDFSATALIDETSATVGKGRFSDAPNGQVCYCNGVDKPQIWAGDEQYAVAFITSTAAIGQTITNPRDYSSEVSNDLSDEDQVAILGGGDDSYAKVLLHMNGADGGSTITDDGETGHTWTATGAVTDIDQKKFGTASAYFDGSNDKIDCDADHADFDFDDGDFTIEAWVRLAAWPTNLDERVGIYTQYADADNYITFGIEKLGSVLYHVRFKAVLAGATVINLVSSNIYLPYRVQLNRWHHYAVTRYGDIFTIYLDGESIGSYSDSDDMPDIAAAPTIGYDASASGSNWLSGWIDELRITKGISRYITAFTPQEKAFFAGVYYFVVGTIRPAQGIKFYFPTGGGNSITSPTLTAKYWNGSSWTAVPNPTDGTSGLASTGSVTWDSTTDLAKVKHLFGRIVYWYQFALSAGTAQIYKVTVDMPWQPVQNLWDGNMRIPFAFFHWDNSENQFLDYTLDVNVDANVSYATGPVASLDNLAASDDYVLVGFSERMRGVFWRMFKTEVNSTASCDLAVYYWNGAGWAAVSALNDATAQNGISLAKSGLVTWEPPLKSEEFRTEINDSTPLYFYKFVWDAVLDASVDVDRILGIAQGESIKPHKFSVMHRNRLLLCNEVDGDKNSILPSAVDAPDCFNGPDAGSKIFMGDDKGLTAAASFYTRYGADMFYQLVVCKKNETWLLDGDGYTGSNPWRVFKISGVIGCPAPNTMVVADIGHELAPAILKQIVIWLSDVGPMIFDGNTIMPVGEDIADYWNPVKSTTYINTAQIADAYAWYDSNYNEYHLCIPTGSNTTNDTELVYNLEYKKWFKINRDTGQAIQVGFTARDTNGRAYTLGTIDTGFLLQLEDSNAMISSAITSYFETVDIPLSGSMFRWHLLEYFKLACVSKPSTPDDTITVTVYKDTETSGTNVGTFVNEESGQRCVINVEPAQVIAGVTHRVKVSVAVSDVAEGFEPLAIGYGFRVPEDEPEVVD